MPVAATVLVLVAPFVLTFVVAAIVQRLAILPSTPNAETAALNTVGKLTAAQRAGLLAYAAPEIIFSLTALTLAIVWVPSDDLRVLALRWGLGGMALVRIGLSWPMWRDIFGGRVATLSGPLRKIAVGNRRALATEDGPIVVLPVEHAIYNAHAANAPATIFYARHSKQVVGVISEQTVAAPVVVSIEPAER